MSAVEYSRQGLAAGFADGCDRLLDPAVAGADRGRQKRFVAAMLTWPFVLGVSWPAIAGAFSFEIATAALAIAFVVAWAAIVWVASRATLATPAITALVVAVAPLSLAIASLGGLATPALLVALALPVEAWWCLRSRNALAAGSAALAAVVAAQLPLHAYLQAEPVFAAWHWLMPLTYAVFATHRQTHERRLRLGDESTAGQSPPVDALDCAVLTFTDTGEVSDAAGAVDELTGVVPELLMGASFLERVQVGDRVAYLTALADARDGRKPGVVRLRLRVAGEAGVYRPFTLNFRQSDPVRAVLRDDAVTSALRAENQVLRDLADGAEVAKARFLATVSHELRTPLNAIIGFADMLALEIAGPLADPRQQHYASLIRESGGHLLDIVNSILDASRLKAGTYPLVPEPFDFASAARTSCAMLKLQAEAKGIELVNETGALAVHINADRRAVQQILINLLSNAVKFTPPGGRVRLDARRNGSRLVIEVSDTGIGIGATDLERLCRPFVQVQNDYTRQFDGAGLGLSIAKGLVEMHRGSMTIESAEGHGTIVTVTLPIEGPSAAARRLRDTQATEDADAPIRKSA